MKKMFLLLLSIIFLCSCQQFSTDKWLNDPENRNDIVNNLTKKHELIGETESGIINLLGEPDQEINETDHETNEPIHQYVYYLGKAGLGVKVYLLVITFGEYGEVKSYKIRQS